MLLSLDQLWPSSERGNYKERFCYVNILNTDLLSLGRAILSEPISDWVYIWLYWGAVKFRQSLGMYFSELIHNFTFFVHQKIYDGLILWNLYTTID